MFHGQQGQPGAREIPCHGTGPSTASWTFAASLSFALLRANRITWSRLREPSSERPEESLEQQDGGVQPIWATWHHAQALWLPSSSSLPEQGHLQALVQSIAVRAGTWVLRGTRGQVRGVPARGGALELDGL